MKHICKSVRNKGAAGVDGIPYTELKEHFEEHGEEIREQLRTRTYKPQPVLRVEIPKPDGCVRNLEIPTVTDGFVKQSVAQVLPPIFEEYSIYNLQLYNSAGSDSSQRGVRTFIR